MSKELELLERVDLYLEGKLSSEEKAALEAQMEADSSLAELVQHQKVSNELILGERLHNVKALMDQDFAAGKVKGGTNGLKWWTGGLVLAGAVVLFLLVQPSTTSLVSVNEKKVPVENKKYDNDRKPTPPETQASDQVAGEKKVIKNPVKKEKPSAESKEEPLIPADEEREEEVSGKDDIIEEIKIAENKIEIPEPVIPQEKTVTETKAPEHKPEKPEVAKAENVRIRKGEDHGFKPEFGEVFQLTVPEGKEAEIRIMNRAGNIVFSRKAESEQFIWDGRTLQGGIAQAGLYIYILEFANGEKESGQIIIY